MTKKEFAEGVLKHFGVSASLRYMDRVMFVATRGKATLDVIAFDEQFLRTPDGVSMNQEIEKRFGKDALDFAKKTLGAI